MPGHGKEETPLYVVDEGQLHRYRTEIPNLVVRGHYPLSVHAKWLYVYLKSVAGDAGSCWQSTSTIAEQSGLSRMTVSRAKQELVTAALVKVTMGTHANRNADTITIVDIWLENMQQFSCTSEVHQQLVENTAGCDSGVPERYTGVPGGYSGVPGGYERRSLLRRSLEEREREECALLSSGKAATASKTEKKKKGQQEREDVREVREYLNAVTGKGYRTAPIVAALLNTTDATVVECKLVIDWWKAVKVVADPDQQKFFTSETPFRVTKFDMYRAEAEKWDRDGRLLGASSSLSPSEALRRLQAQEEPQEEITDV